MKILNPVSIMWESTIACGLACKHCKASAKKNPDRDELTTTEAYRLVDQMVEFGREYPILRITGGNALLRSDIFKIIRYARDLGVRVTIAPSTTPLLHRENLRRLKDSGVEVVAMSIDGPNAELHDSFRGVKGTFNIMVKAVKYMREIKLPFRLMTTVSKFNAKELPEILSLSEKLGAVGWYLYMLIPTGRAKEEYALTPQEYEDVFNFIYDAMKVSNIPINAIAGSEPYRRVAVLRRKIEEGEVDEGIIKHGKLYRYLKKRLRESYFPTSNARENEAVKHKDKSYGKGIFVSNRGEVFPSSFLPIGIGNVKYGNLVEIYRSSKILKDMQNPEKLKGRCRVCEFNDICRGSRSRAYALTGDYLAEDPYCVYQPGNLEKTWDNRVVLSELRVSNYSRPTMHES
jgi:radical SAM protein